MKCLSKGLEPMFSTDEIGFAIDRVALQLNLDLADERPVFVCILKGGLPFTSELMKRTTLDMELDYVRVRRYSGTSGGELQYETNISQDFSGRTIVLIDDVFDRGVTLNELKRVLSKSAARVLTAVLVDKVQQREVDIEPDYVALEAPNEFLVGCGMDMDGRYRQLPSIYALRDWH